MRKFLILLNISALFLTSCATYSDRSLRTPGSAADCNEWIAQIYAPKAGGENVALKSHLDLDLTASEVEDFVKEFGDPQIATEHRSFFRGIFLYTSGNEEARRELLREFHEELSGVKDRRPGKLWSKFKKNYDKVSAKTQKMMKGQSTEAGQKAALKKSEIYEKLYYSCKSEVRATDVSEANSSGSKRLVYALSAGNAAATATTYSAVNWDKEKDWRWLNELLYILALGSMVSYINGKLFMANEKLAPWTGRAPLTYLSRATSDAGVSALYGYLFGEGPEKIKREVEALAQDPQAMKKLEELVQVAEEKGLWEKYLPQTQALFMDKKTGRPMEGKHFPEGAKIDDIDLSASRELLMEALSEKMYADHAGVLQTGGVGADRFTFHRLYDLMTVPYSIGLSLIMKDQMCMSANPKEGFTKAMMTYMAAALLSDTVYFKVRREVINQ